MVKIPIGVIIKQIMDEKRLKALNVAKNLGVTRQAVYQSYAKQEMTDGEMSRWADAMGVTKEEVMARWKAAISGETIHTTVDTDGSNYLQVHLANLESQFRELNEQFRSQLAMKDKQIDGLQRTVDVLLGKSEPATELTKEFPLNTQHSFREIWVSTYGGSRESA